MKRGRGSSRQIIEKFATPALARGGHGHDRSFLMDKNIVLIGMMGSGKSMIAEALARQLGLPLVSTDEIVESQAGCSIKDLVAAKGWKHFRGLEREAVRQVSQKHGIIIDCGGGVVLDPENLALLKKRGIIFHLHAPPSVLYQRLKDDTQRPLLAAPDPLAELTGIYQQRLPLYNQADYTIDASDASIEGPVAQILLKVPA